MAPVHHQPACSSLQNITSSPTNAPPDRAYSIAGFVPARNANTFVCGKLSRRTRTLVCSIVQRVKLSCTTRSSRASPRQGMKDGGTRKLPTAVKLLVYLAGSCRRQPSFSLPRIVVPPLTTPCHSLRLETTSPAISSKPFATDDFMARCLHCPGGPCRYCSRMASNMRGCQPQGVSARSATSCSRTVGNPFRHVLDLPLTCPDELYTRPPGFNP